MNELPFVYQVRRSLRVKNARIVVKAEQVEVVAPPAMSERIIKKFVFDKRVWISQTLDKLTLRQQSIASLAPAVYADGAEIPFQGQSYRLTLAEHTLKRVKIEFDGGFTAWIPQHNQADRHELVRLALIKWVHKQAAVTAQQLLQQHSQLHGLVPRSIRIKTQKSRWGSCGIHDDINLNWVLMLAPPSVFEYVLVHEICHIRHRNHSAQFWSLVAEHMPDYKQHRQWLNDHGSALMLGL